MSSGPQSPVRFGLIGCGVIAETVAAAFSGLVEAHLVAVTDVLPERAASFAQAHGVQDAGSTEALLARTDIDAVYVCVPSGAHAQVGLSVASAGKHIVVEKPIDVTVEAAQRLIDAAARAGVSLHVISQRRYDLGTRRAQQLLDQGSLGEPLFVSASVPWFRSDAYYASSDWRATWALDGGGAFMNQGVHYADLLCWLFGRPTVLAAKCATLGHDIEVEDLALALLAFKGGGLGLLEASTISYPGGQASLRVNCSGGTIFLQDGALVALEAADGKRRLDDGEELGGLGFPGGHRAQLADIASSITEGRPSPVGGDDGLRALTFVLDVYQASGWGPPAAV